MIRLLLATGVLAALCAPSPGLAFLRSKSTSGACLWWPQRRLELLANADGLPGQQPVCSGVAPLNDVRSALDAWTQAARPGAAPCTDLQLALAGSTARTDVGAPAGGEGPTNLIVWRRGACGELAPANDPCWAPDAITSCATKYNCWEYGDDRTIALTTTSYAVSSGEIVDADIELRGWDGGPAGFDIGGSGWYFTCSDAVSASTPACTRYGESSCVGMDLQSVLTHELGHVIGIADQYTTPEGTMYGYAANGETLKRTLAATDAEAVCSIYPVGASTPSCGSQPLQSTARRSSGGGCSSTGDALTLIGLAVTSLALSLRRRPMPTPPCAELSLGLGQPASKRRAERSEGL